MNDTVRAHKKKKAPVHFCVDITNHFSRQTKNAKATDGIVAKSKLTDLFIV
jgi:hypothetical protein